MLQQTIHKHRNVPPTTFDEIPMENTSFDRSHEHPPLTFSRNPDFPLAKPQFTHSDNSSFLQVSKFPGNKQAINLQTSELPVSRISVQQSNMSIPRILNSSEIRHNSFDKNMYGNHSGPIQKQNGTVYENSDLLTSSPTYHSNIRQERSRRYNGGI